MIRLPPIIRRLGNDGAVTNVRHELVSVDEVEATVAVLTERVQTIDTARAAASLVVQPAAA